jgi:protein arginine kinase
VRLARNLKGYRFPNMACNAERRTVLECIQTAITDLKKFNDVHCISIDALSPLERRVLEEKHLISPLFVKQGIQRFVIITKTPDFSILVNEEDHLRIQTIRTGMQIWEVWNTTKNLEMCLKEKLDFAYSEQYGYLTTCSSNAGTGIRASVMMFLPGLILLKQITPILQKVNSLGYTVRGMSGEGSKSQGYLLQISRQIPYGKNEGNVLRSLEKICYRIIKKEKRARFQILSLNGRKIGKYIEQTYRNLSTAKQVKLEAGTRMLATLRLGIALKIGSSQVGTINSEKSRSHSLKKIDELFTQIQPAHVLTHGFREHQGNYPENSYLAEQAEEDSIRAKVIQCALNKVLNVEC